MVKRVDEVSPDLFQAAAQGDPIAKLEIVLAKGSSKAVYRFTDVFVTSVRPGGSASSGDEPREEVSFSGIFESSSHSQ